jgi:hypothetical protein
LLSTFLSNFLKIVISTKFLHKRENLKMCLFSQKVPKNYEKALKFRDFLKIANKFLKYIIISLTIYGRLAVLRLAVLRLAVLRLAVLRLAVLRLAAPRLAAPRLALRLGAARCSSWLS